MGNRPLCLLTTFLVVFLTVSLSAQAIEVPESQRSIIITIERGASFSFPLILKDINEVKTVKASGEADAWIKFGPDGESKYEIYPSDQTTIDPVTIEVPEDEDLGEYEAEITAGTSILTKVIVKVTLELSDTKAYEKLSAVDEEVGFLRETVYNLSATLDSVRSELSDYKEQVSENMNEISEYQKDLQKLEEDNQQLQTQNSELSDSLQTLETRYTTAEESNRELNALTGMMASTHLPGMFLGGLAVGIISLTLIIKREHVARKIKKKMNEKAHENKKKDNFSYSFKS